MEILEIKTKTMAVCGKSTVRAKNELKGKLKEDKYQNLNELGTYQIVMLTWIYNTIYKL